MYKETIRPILDRLDSETWHSHAVEALHFAEATPFTLKLLEQFADQRQRFTDQRLNVMLGAIELDNPIMVGAGWDKKGRAVQGLYTLGFSGVEVGSVLAYPQPGNPKPRQFMLSPGVALNHLGFNSDGMDPVALNLKRYQNIEIPIGISIGKNKLIPDIAAPDMYAIVADKLYDAAAYFAIDVSSPNTPGLRQLQDRQPLEAIAQAVNSTMDLKGQRKPIFVKISPDLENEAVTDVIRVVADNDLAGIIATNTTNNPDIKANYGPRWRNREGGVSGDDAQFRKTATEKITHIYRETGGKMEIIGVGGVKDAGTALEKLKAGAKVVQIVTAIRGEGLTVPGRINRELIAWMNHEGVHNIAEIIGLDH